MPYSSIHQQISEPLLRWFDKHGRKDLPWQVPREAYRIWVSEIMLQQTQVKTVIPYFMHFIDRFPDVTTLAQADEDTVLAHWSGLGYYSRARNLHKTAQIIHTELNGKFPDDPHHLIMLPGIGRTTAAAITSLAFNKPTAILDGNVKRVLSRYFLVDGAPQQAMVQKKLWQLAQVCMPKQRAADYTQAIMDLGATCCTTKNPHCSQCPLKLGCLALIKNKVSDYPNKKIKKNIPTEHQQFLVLHTDNNLIYLEKRPPKGIWGGLWCLPSIGIDDCPKTFINTRYQLDTKTTRELMQFKHSFTHYHLQIRAISIATIIKKTALSNGTGRWFSPDELPSLGMAKPVSTILQFFYHGKA